MHHHFIALLESHQQIIYRVIHDYCHDRQEHDDLYQEICKELWIAHQKWQQRCSYSSWVYRIAKNTAIDRIRHFKRRIQTVGLHNIFYDIADVPAEEPQEVSLSILTEFERELLLLWAEGKSSKHIGGSIGISANYVNQRIFRIKQKLRAYYGFRK